MSEQNLIGYEDYQRTANWDGPRVYESVKEITGKVNTGLFNVSRYSNLSLTFVPVITNEEGIYIRVRWWSENDRVILLGERVICLRQRSESPENPDFNAHIQNLGPWCEVEIEPQIEGNSWAYTAYVTVDNRLNMIQLPVHAATLIPFTEHKIKGGEEVFIYPRFHYAGRMIIAQFISRIPFGVGVQVFDSVLHQWIASVEMPVSEADQWIPLPEILIPLGAWRFSLFNPEGGTQTVFTVGQSSANG